MINRLFVCMIAVSCLWGAAPAQTQVKCAVIAGRDAAPDVLACVSLLEVRLSQDERIRLVERAELDRVLQEQQLSAAGLASRDSIIKAGQLLRAEAFVLLSVEDGQEPKAEQGKSRLVRVRVAETAHGLRLWEGYETLEASQVEAAATQIAEKVRTAVDKIAQINGPAIPVGIVDIHRVQLPEKYEPLARVLPGLLSARLGKERRIIMLERESLGTLLREKQLTEGPDEAFWNSAVLIDGYIQPGADRSIEMSLRLHRASGDEMSTLALVVDPNLPLTAVETAARRIVPVLLDMPSSGQWEPAREAQEFFAQGGLLGSHGRYAAATVAFEAAHALQPDNVHYTGALFRNEWGARSSPEGRLFVENLATYSDLQLAELASVLIRQIQAGSERGSLTVRTVWDNWAYALACDWQPRGYLASRVSVANETVRDINRVNRRIWYNTMVAALDKQQIRPGSPSLNPMNGAKLAWVSSDDAKEVIANVKTSFARATMPLELGGIVTSPDERARICRQLFMQYRMLSRGTLKNGHLCAAVDEVLALWREYETSLAEVRDPLVRFYALVTLSWEHASGGGQDRTEAQRLCRKALEVLLGELKSPNEPFSDKQKADAREEYRMCFERASFGADERSVIWQRIYGPLIEARDAHNLALWDPGNRYSGIYSHGGDPDLQNPYRQLLEKAAEVLRSKPDDPLVGEALTRLRDSLSEARKMEFSTNPVRKETGHGAMMLLRAEDWPRKRKMNMSPQVRERGGLQAKVAGNTLLVAFLFDTLGWEAERMMGLAVIDLTAQRVRSVRQTLAPSGYDLPLSSITGIALIEDTAYVAMDKGGIVRFDAILSDSRQFLESPRILTEKDGLPFSGVTGMVEDDDKLWIAHSQMRNESGLGLYDPATGRWESVLCSALKNDEPFNAGHTYRISSLMAVPPDRLYFATYVMVGRPRSEDQERQYYRGFWCMDTKRRKPAYLGITVMSGLAGTDGRLLLRDWYSLVEFDPASQQAQLIMGRPCRVSLPLGEMTAPAQWRKAPFISESVSRQLSLGPHSTGQTDLSTAVIHDDRLWIRSGLSQITIIPRGAMREQIVTVDSKILDNGEVLQLVSTPHGLIGIGHGTVGFIESAINLPNQSTHTP